jgi:hypothetical protein
MSGLSPNPLMVSPLASRCQCGVCGRTPAISSPSMAGDAVIVITAECCGKKETKHVKRSELVFTQVFFAEDAGGDTEL